MKITTLLSLIVDGQKEKHLGKTIQFLEDLRHYDCLNIRYMIVQDGFLDMNKRWEVIQITPEIMKEEVLLLD